MFVPELVKALPDFCIWIRYSDGAEGEVDLSHMAGKGIFKAWLEPGVFEKVRVGEHGEIRWTDEMELCPDALYLRLTGKNPEDVFPSLRSTPVDA